MNGNERVKIARLLCGCLVLALAGCARMEQLAYLSGCDRDINNATRAIASARVDAQRAEAYSKRGGAYSEKARYSRMFKLVSGEEYERLFDLAMKDHAQAVWLAPASVEVYLNRGQVYYDRATLELHNDAKRWFERAAADFETAALKDPRDYRALDHLGLVHQQSGEPEQALEDFTKEMALNPLGKARLVDAYCTVASK